MKKSKKIGLFMASVLAIIGISIAGGLATTSRSFAESPTDAISGGLKKVKTSKTQKEIKPSKIISNVVSVMLFIVGALAVIFIIVSGIQFITSGGDTAKATKARQTLTYSIVGLIVAVLAYAIVRFVIGNILKDAAA